MSATKLSVDKYKPKLCWSHCHAHEEWSQEKIRMDAEKNTKYVGRMVPGISTIKSSKTKAEKGENDNTLLKKCTKVDY